MKRNQNKQSFMQKVKEWIKAHKIWSIIIAIAIIIIAFAVDGANQEQQKQDNKQAVEKSEKQHAKEDKAKKEETDKKEVANKSEKVENDVQETKADVKKNEQSDELSDEFRTDSSNYLNQVATAYMTLGDLQTATSESEMMSIIKEGQAEYDKANQYYNAIDPQNDKEQKIYEKISRIDGLSNRALMNVETGLNEYDTELIKSATEDIEQAGDIANEIENEVE